MRWLYTFTLYLFAPFAILRLLIRSLGQPAYRRRISERFGFTPFQINQPSIWVHAVSVGEVQAAVPLVLALAEMSPDCPLLITTTTPTGSARVKVLFGDRVMHCYVPYDLPGSIHRFLQRARPALVIIMERELWPNLIRQCAESNVPVVLANARLSERAGNNYRLFKPLIRDTLSRVTRIAAQGEEDTRQLVRLGVREDVMQVTGNQKFDIQVPDNVISDAKLLRENWGSERMVWVAASTHAGEEEIVLSVFQVLKRRCASLLLVVVPRHPERFAKVADLCRRQGGAVCLLSELACDKRADIIVGDTMGDLMKLYAASDMAFIGGSLVPAGGHNPLEAAVLGKPTVFGPYMRNVAETSKLLLSTGASRQAGNAQQLEQIVRGWIKEPGLREKAGQQAIELVQQHRGATAKVVGMVRGLLDK